MDGRTTPAQHLALADPSTFDEAATKARLQRAADAHSSARREAAARSGAAGGPAYDALRAAFLGLPGVQDAHDVLAKRVRPPQRRLVSARSPAPQIRLGSEVIETPPFRTGSGVNQTGKNYVAIDVRDSGHAGVEIGAGEQGVNGTVDCWAAVGHAVYVQPEFSTVQCRISCNVFWDCQWHSYYWRQAAGNVWIGMAMNRMRLDGSFIDQPVATQAVLTDFDDRNLDDNGDQPGLFVGYSLSSAIPTTGPLIVECYLWVGAHASAYPLGSGAYSEISADLTSMAVDIF